MPSALTKRVTRLECIQPAQHRLLTKMKIPITEWPEELLLEFLEAMGEESSTSRALLAALSTLNLEELIRMLGP